MGTLHKLLLASAAALLILSCDKAIAEEIRQWSDSSGAYQVMARLVTADEDLVVLQRTNGELIGVRPGQLSQRDQRVVKQALETRNANGAAADMQWELRAGEPVNGRLNGFGRQVLRVKRERGDLLVNDRPIDELPPAYRKILPTVVSVVDQKKVEDLEELESHLADLGGGPFEYVVEGVQLDLREKGQVTIPLAMLTADEAAAISPSFKRWKASQEKSVSERDRYETETRERMNLEAQHRMRQQLPRRGQSQQGLADPEPRVGQAKLQRGDAGQGLTDPEPRVGQARLRSGQSRQRSGEMRLMELGLLSVEAGLTDIWEVAIMPRNSFGYGRTVVVSAPNSLIASRKVASKFPGWRIGAVVKRSN